MKPKIFNINSREYKYILPTPIKSAEICFSIIDINAMDNNNIKIDFPKLIKETTDSMIGNLYFKNIKLNTEFDLNKHFDEYKEDMIPLCNEIFETISEGFMTGQREKV